MPFVYKDLALDPKGMVFSIERFIELKKGYTSFTDACM
ncbi:hypothetical protein SEA_ATUIN_289 [Arthrobacter phage Atuin]|nr:hypothetical protein SEA_ATUIN_88 [Arthrobacter phage Atuin]